MRLYEGMWKKLRDEGFIFVKCKHASQKVVVKAIQKEKYMDEKKDELISKKMTVVRHPHGVEFRIVGKPSVKDF